MPPTQPLDYHKEYSFRRGCVHGVEQLITTLEEKLSRDDLMAIKDWREELLGWERSKGASVFEHPPLPKQRLKIILDTNRLSN